MTALQIKCKGKVQGVFFRVSTKERADQFGLKGWVRNESDGSVAIHAEGDTSSLEQLVKWCKKGPQFARVDEVSVKESQVEGFSSFGIKR